MPGLALLLTAFLASWGTGSRGLGLLFKYAAILHLLASAAVAASLAAYAALRRGKLQPAEGRVLAPAPLPLGQLLPPLLVLAGTPAVVALLLWIAAARRSRA